MSKKKNSKSKPVSKGKAKKATSTSKKIAVKKKAKPAAKKASSGKAVKSKSKAVSKPAKKGKAKVAAKAKATKPVAKSKASSPVKAKQIPAKPSKPAKPTREVGKPVSSKEAEKNQEAPAKPVVNPNRPSVGRPLPVNRRPEPARAIISNSKPEKETGKNRYADNELEEFREIINKKLEDARRELATLQAQMTAANEHGTDDTASTFKILEDGSDSLAKEEAGQLASRQKKFIEQLENALVRIENKTYGICRVTGKLIPKERLRAVPHTTQSIEAKLNQYRD